MNRSILAKIAPRPKQLFLIDGLGAALSAILLGVVLVQFQPLFGIPKPTLYFLAFLPCVFATYDFFCFFRVHKNAAPFLVGMAWANLLYCGLSIGLALYHSSTITALGWAYILVEVAIVMLLAALEFRVAARL